MPTLNNLKNSDKRCANEGRFAHPTIAYEQTYADKVGGRLETGVSGISNFFERDNLNFIPYN